MGLFDKLFNIAPAYPEDVQYELEYATIFESLGFTRSQARKVAKEMVKKARKMVVDRGQLHEPPNYGDWLLSLANTDAKLKNHLDTVRAEGVTEKDIRDWWNLPPTVRTLVELGNEQNEMTAWLESMRNGMSSKEAMVVVRRLHPIYGIADVSKNEGDDAPIPYELGSRVTTWRLNQAEVGTLAAMKNSQRTLNSRIREGILSGTI